MGTEVSIQALTFMAMEAGLMAIGVLLWVLGVMAREITSGLALMVFGLTFIVFSRLGESAQIWEKLHELENNQNTGKPLPPDFRFLPNTQPRKRAGRER